jgi:hypothetical protein
LKKHDHEFMMYTVVETVVLPKAHSQHCPTFAEVKIASYSPILCCKFVAPKSPYVHTILTEAAACITQTRYIHTGTMRTNFLSYYRSTSSR